MNRKNNTIRIITVFLFVTLLLPLFMNTAKAATAVTLSEGRTGEHYSAFVISPTEIFPATIEMTAGTVPPGLDFGFATEGGKRSMKLEGTPTKAGSYSFTYIYGYDDGREEEITYSVTILAKATAPSLTVEPQASYTIERDEVLRLSVVAASAENGKLYYQWYIAPSESEDGVAIEGAINSYCDVDTKVVGIYYYYCVVRNNIDGSEATIESTVAEVTVKEKTSLEPKITQQPQSGETEQFKKLELKITAASQDGGKLSYQWLKTDSKGESTQYIASANEMVCEVNTELSGTYYYICEVSNTKEGFVTTVRSEIAVINIKKHEIHSYDTSKVTKIPTCTEAGTRTRSCFCSVFETETIPAIGHDWGKWEITTAPTKQSQGVRERVCTRCGATEVEKIERLSSELDFPKGFDMSNPVKIADTAEETSTGDINNNTESNKPGTGIYIVVAIIACAALVSGGVMIYIIIKRKYLE